jgi:thymidylate synthase (FAD)
MSNVNLIWVTPDAESLLAYIARVSNPKNQQVQLESESPEQMNSRLIKYLIKNKHWSPFEMVNACFEINTTRAISAQILRHRSFAFQEFSQRYSAVSELPEFHFPEIRYAGTTNRQSSMTAKEKDVDIKEHRSLEFLAHNTIIDAQAAYFELLEKGVAPESARMILPMCSPTRLYMNGTLRSWIHYLQIRLEEEHVQKEHVEIAKQINNSLSNLFPLTWKALND